METRITAILSARVDAFITGINQAATRLQKFGEDAERHGKALSVAVSLPLAVVGYKAIEAATKMDSLGRGLIAVTGSAAAAAGELIKLREVAKLPGLGLEEAIKGSINLQAAGFSADLSRKALLGFGNALATVGKGKADLDGVITALSQIASKGKISAEEINQLAERVPQIRKIMEAAFGTANTEVLQKMGIDSQTFVEKVTNELNKLPKVTGGMGNAFENFSDTVTNSFASIGEAINNAVGIASTLDKVSKVIEGLTERFAALSPAMQTVVVATAAIMAVLPVLMGAIGVFTTTILPALTAGFAALNTSLGLVGIAVVALAVAYTALKSSTDGVANATSVKNSALVEAKKQLKGAVEGTGEYIQALKDLQAEYIKTRIVELESDLANPTFLSRLKATFLGGGNMLLGAGDVIAGQVQELAELRKAYGEVFNPTEVREPKKEKRKATEEELAAAKKALDDYVKAQSDASKSVIDSLQRVRDISISLIKDETERKREELKAQASDRRAQVEVEVQSEIVKAREIKAINEKLAADLAEIEKKSRTLGGFDVKKQEGKQVRSAGTSSQAQSGLIADVLAKSSKLPGLKEFMEKADQAIEDVNNKTQQMREAAKAMGATLSDTFAQFGEAVARGENPFKNFGKTMLGFLADVLQQISRKMLAAAAAFFAGVPLTAGLTAPQAIRMAAAGAILGAAAGAMRVPALAKGGEVFGPTIAMVGDNKNAHIDPELVGPSSVFRTMMREELGGGGGGASYGILRGSDIYLAGFRETKIQDSFLR